MKFFEDSTGDLTLQNYNYLPLKKGLNVFTTGKHNFGHRKSALYMKYRSSVKSRIENLLEQQFFPDIVTFP